MPLLRFLPTDKLPYTRAHIFVLLVLLGMVSWLPCTQAQNKLGLSQAIKAGISNKKSITAGRSDLQINELTTKALHRQYLPTLEVEYAYMYHPILQTSILPIGIFNPAYPIDATQSVQFGTTWTQVAGLTLSQPLINFGILRAIHEAEVNETITAVSQELTEYELAYQIAKVYINLLLEESALTARIADTSRSFVSFSLQKSRFDQKSLLRSDFNNAAINHLNTVQLYSDALSLLAEERMHLKYLMGTENDTLLSLELDTVFMAHFQPTIEQVGIRTTQLPELYLFDLNQDLNTAQIHIAQNTHMPVLKLNGYLGANQFTNRFEPVQTGTWYGISYIGLNLKIPILTTEHTQVKMQQLKIKSAQIMLQKEDKSAEYIRDARVSLIRIDNLNQQLATQQATITLRTNTVEIHQARVKQGQESASSLNTEEAELLLLEANYHTNQKKLWLYWLDYLKSTGQLAMLWE